MLGEDARNLDISESEMLADIDNNEAERAKYQELLDVYMKDPKQHKLDIMTCEVRIKERYELTRKIKLIMLLKSHPDIHSMIWNGEDIMSSMDGKNFQILNL